MSRRTIWLFLLHSFLASLGVIVISGLLANIVLGPFIGTNGKRALFLIPPFPGVMVCGAMVGAYCRKRFNFDYFCWSWFLPTAYLVYGMALSYWQQYSQAGVLANGVFQFFPTIFQRFFGLHPAGLSWQLEYTVYFYAALTFVAGGWIIRKIHLHALQRHFCEGKDE